MTLKILEYGDDLNVELHWNLYLPLLIYIIYIVLIIFVLCFLGVLYGNIKSSMCIFIVFTIDLLQLFVILIFLYLHYESKLNMIWWIWIIYLIIAIGIPALSLSITIVLVFTDEARQNMHGFHCLIKLFAVILLIIIAILSISVLFTMIVIFSCGLSYIWIWIVIMAMDAPMYEIHPRGQFSQWIIQNTNNNYKKNNNNKQNITNIYKLSCLNSLIANRLDITAQNTNATDSARQYLLQQQTDLFKNVKLPDFCKNYPELSIMKRLDKEVLNSLLIGENENKILHFIQKYSLFWYMFMRIPNMLAPFIIISYLMLYQYYDDILFLFSQQYLLLIVFLSLDVLFIGIALILFGSMMKRLYYGWHIMYAKDSIYKQVKKDLYNYLLLLYSKGLIRKIIIEDGIAEIIIDYVGIHDLNLT